MKSKAEKIDLNKEKFKKLFASLDEDDDKVENLNNEQYTPEYVHYLDVSESEEKNQYSVDANQLQQFGDPKITTADEATEFVNFTMRRLFKLHRYMSEARALVFFAIHWELHILMGIKRKELISRLHSASKKCRDSVSQYVCIAQVESQLKIQNGVMSIQALMALYRCNKETRGEILEIAQSHKKSADEHYASIPKKGKAKLLKRQPTLFPTLGQVEHAVKHYALLEKKRKTAIESSEDPFDVEVDFPMIHTIPQSKQKTFSQRLNAKRDEEDSAENAILADPHKHFARLRKNEKIKNKIDHLVEHGTIDDKKRLLAGISTKKGDKFKFYSTRLLAYNDAKRIQEIMRSLKRDIEEYDNNHV